MGGRKHDQDVMLILRGPVSSVPLSIFLGRGKVSFEGSGKGEERWKPNFANDGIELKR